MARRMMVFVAVLSTLAALQCGPASAAYENDDIFDEMAGPVIVVEVFYITASLMLTWHNTSRMNAGDPSTVGGAFGLLVGSTTGVLGVACVFFDEPAVQTLGVAAAAVGIHAAYVGVRSLGAARRKNLEKMGRDVSLGPILIDDGSGRVGPGIQVSLRF